jgi:hypothetical protein
VDSRPSSLLFGAETPPVSADKLLTPGAAGPFRIGMKVDDVKSLTRQEKIKLVDLNGEGLFWPAIVIYPGVVAEIIMNDHNEWVIGRLFISDPTYYTPKGIHVGSKFSEIKMKYPSSKVSHEEGEHVIDEGAGITFDLSDGPLPSSVVKSIMLFRKP